MILFPGALCAGFDANSGKYFQLLLVIIKETVRNLFFSRGVRLNPREMGV